MKQASDFFPFRKSISSVDLANGLNTKLGKSANLSDLANLTTAKTTLGIDNVSNTSDAAKPISTATQTALNLKGDLSVLNLKADAAATTASLALKADAVATTASLAAKADAAATTASLALKADAAATTAALNLKINTSLLGANSGVATLNSSGKVPATQLEATGGYISTWNATTNTPTIVSSVGTAGNFYIVATAGSTTINGVSGWVIGDQIRFNGTVWEKIANVNAVSSVAGRTGAVVLTSADVGLGNADNTSDANKPVSTAQATALSGKVNVAGSVVSVAGRSGTVVLTKSDVGLGSVDNIAATSLRDRSTHTGTQLASSISDFSEATDDRVANLLVAGANISLTYNDAANTLTVASTGGGGFAGDGSGVTDAKAFRLNLKIQEVWPEDEGAVGDGVTNDATAMQAAINLAISTGRVLRLSKFYRINANLVGSGNPLIIQGTTPEACGLIFGTNNGLTFTGTHGEYGADTLCLDGFSLLATNQSTNAAVTYTSTAGIGGTNGSIILNNLNIKGDGIGTSFKNGVVMGNARNVFINNIIGMGDRGNLNISHPPAFNADSILKFTASSTTSPVEYKIFNVNTNFVKYGIWVDGTSADAMEGFYISNYTAVACHYGIYDVNSVPGGDPLFFVTDSHMNCYVAGLFSQGHIQLTINNNNFGNFTSNWDAANNIPALVSSVGTTNETYIVNAAGTTNINGNASWVIGDRIQFNGSVWVKNGIGAATFTGISINNNSGANLNGTIKDNTYLCTGMSLCTGVVIASTSSGQDNVVIGGNKFDALIGSPMQTGIWVQAAATGVHIKDDNLYVNCNTKLLNDAGASTTIEHALLNIGSGVVALKRSVNLATLSEFQIGASIYPATNNARSNGTSSLRWSTVFSVDANFSGTSTIATANFSGVSTFNGSVGFNGGFNCSTGAAFASNVTVAGSLTGGSLIASGSLTVGGNAGITGTLTTGAITGTTANFSGALTGTALTASTGTFSGNISANAGITIASGQSIGQGGGSVRIRDSLYPNSQNDLFLGTATLGWDSVWSENGLFSSSDRSLKENITNVPVDEAYKLLREVPAVTFTRISKPDAEPKTGIIAQDLQAASNNFRTASGLVVGDDGILHVNYVEFITHILPALRDMDARLTAMEERLNSNG